MKKIGQWFSGFKKRHQVLMFWIYITMEILEFVYAIMAAIFFADFCNVSTLGLIVLIMIFLIIPINSIVFESEEANA